VIHDIEEGQRMVFNDLPRYERRASVKALQHFVLSVDKFTEKQALIVCWFIFPLIFVLDYEITARYVFNAPTIWAYDFTYIFYGLFYMLAGAYTLLKDEHVRIEILYMKMSPRVRSTVEIFGYLIFFFPVFIAYLYYGVHFAWDSYVLQETAKESIFAPTIWPYKAVMPIAALLLLIQGLANFIRHCLIILGREV